MGLLIALGENDINDHGEIKSEKNLRGATSIYATDLEKLIKLDNLSEGLEVLSLSGSGIVSLKNLPKSLKYLVLNECTNLSELVIDGSFVNLKILNLEGCDEKLLTKKFREDLQKLEQGGCKIIYPNDAKNINEATARVEKLNQSATYNLYRLFNRYLTEDLGNRDRAGLLAENVISLLNILDSKPEYFSFVEDIATKFVGEGCINQPVAGFFEMATWLLASQREYHNQKIDTLSPLMIFYNIVYLIKSELQQNQTEKLTPAYEVEVAIALLKAVHNKLLTEGKIELEWLGVPQKIANEDHIEVRKFLTEENINKVYNLTKIFLDQNPQEKIKFFESAENAKIWGAIAFPEALKDVKEESARSSPVSETDSPNTFKRYVRDIESVVIDKIMELTRAIFPARQVISPMAVPMDFGRGNEKS